MSHDSRRWTGRGYPQPPAPPADRRRRWVPALLAGLMLAAVGALVFQIAAGSEPRDMLPLNWPLLIPGLFAASSLSPFARGALIPSARAGHDEFEREALGIATTRAYAILLGLLLLTFGWWWWADLNGWPGPRQRADWLGCAVALLVVATNLPALLAELAVPFPTDQGESDA